MKNSPPPPQVKPGEFPFPLTDGPDESPFLTWLRNHSNYMAVGGFPDYFRMAAVLVRGILINNLVLLPGLLVIALAFSLVYSGLLNDWNDQATPKAKEVRLANIARETAQRNFGDRHGSRREEAANAKEALRANRRFENAKENFEQRISQDAPISFFLRKKTIFADAGWARWIQDKWGLTPPFLLTPLVMALAAAWVLFFPVRMAMHQIAGYRQSVVTGSDSSVKSRDRIELTFGKVLLVVVAVALFELLPLLVHCYHQLRQTHLGAEVPWKEYLVTATAVLGALSGAPKLLSMLSGVSKKLAHGLVALVGLLVPLLVIVFVSDFLIYVSIPPEKYFQLLVRIYLVVPGLFSAVILWAILRGWRKHTFSGRECWHLFDLLLRIILAHVVLFATIFVVYGAVFFIHLSFPDVVPDIFLATYDARGFDFWTYGDLAFWVVAGCALEILLFCWLTVDVNLTSIHGLYRDRLAAAYLMSWKARDQQVDIEDDIDLNELCCHAARSTAPYHLVNVTLNLQGSQDISLRDRQSDFFVFSKKFIGGDRTGYCRSATMEQVFPQIDLASAMAISAAAASPNMGRGTSPALVAFLTLINARLGVWIPNPGRLEENPADPAATRKNTADREGRKPGFTFAEVYGEEARSIEQRWQQLGSQSVGRSLADRSTPTPANRLAGIGFSGGGIRSATINLGIAQALHRAGIFDHFDYMSTVSGGGYLGSSISTLMRSKTSSCSEYAGKVTITKEGQEQIVRVTAEQGAVHVYSYSQDAQLVVKNDEIIHAGQRLIRRPGARHRSEIAGTVSVEGLEGEPKIVRITGGQPGELQAYRLTRYDQLAVKTGDSIQAGDLLVKEQNSFLNRFRWRVPPGALWREMMMRLNETDHWVNLSDGGHLENLATIELLRRRCKLIVIGDGEADPQLHFNGLATLMRTAWIDFGIEIEICLDELRLGEPGLDANPRSQSHFAIGRIKYPGKGEGRLLYLKSSYTGDENEVIGEYRHSHPAFPHESTADQWFDEGQFEAYRALGQHIGEKAIQALGLKLSAAPLPFSELEEGFEACWRREEARRARGSAGANGR